LPHIKLPKPKHDISTYFTLHYFNITFYIIYLTVHRSRGYGVYNYNSLGISYTSCGHRTSPHISPHYRHTLKPIDHLHVCMR